LFTKGGFLSIFFQDKAIRNHQQQSKQGISSKIYLDKGGRTFERRLWQ